MLSHQPPELQEVRQQLPFLLHPGHLVVPVPLLVILRSCFVRPFVLEDVCKYKQLSRSASVIPSGWAAHLQNYSSSMSSDTWLAV